MEKKLDGRRLASREEAMAYLTQALDLPGWWGRNLDALYDLLTELTLSLTVEDLVETPFSQKLRRTLEEAEEDNPRLKVTFTP